MSRLTRVEQQRRTHQALLDVGLAVFLRCGFLATTVEEIAAEAGYTRGAVYKHFGGKEGLWQAIVDGQADAQLAGLRELLDGVSSREELVAALSPLDGVAVQWIQVSAEFLAAAAGRPEIAAAIVGAQREREALIVESLTQLCVRLDVRPVMPLPQVVAMLAGLAGSLALRRAIDPSVDAAAITAGVVRAIFPPAGTDG
ncbi:TetR/AcrR family transcriptional regulator [Fodinicola feengrottensis]|uniref:HTH tetR-type domain-containing protein n=1 Tax=Fodinicola feengrottensis TaxID=435914 RepID=A0ABP4U525_9ACTN|nr:TetR/AcrR family transcriptional regulator [Fodinicola feengrottensis]